VWIPPKHGMPPWLPPNVRGGYWHHEYEQTAEEREAAYRSARESARRARERAAAVAAASAALTRARTPAEIARLLLARESESTVSTWTLDMYDDASCVSAWRVLMTSGEYPATHDLIEWKARFREWGFYFRWLPDHVVRGTRRPRYPLWEARDKCSWVDVNGERYRIAGTSPVATAPVRAEMHSGLLDIGGARYGKAVVPHGERFRTHHRRPPSYSRPEHYVMHGFHVEPAGLPRGMDKVDARDLAALLSQPGEDAARVAGPSS
jgi:hypothetical protein